MVLAGTALFGGSSAALAGPVAAQPDCGPVPAGFARCFSLLVTGSAEPYGKPHRGLAPADLQSAYGLPSATLGSGQTVAIVDAFDDPTAESDLALYRSFYGLPPCTSESGCFRKVDQNGGTQYPPPNLGWAHEIALDLDMVSAVCPNCNILLVEANVNTTADLYAAEDEAAVLGANEISNSWGSHDYAGEIADDVHFDRPGIAITAGTGDSGYGVAYPAASPWVTAVGGTSLTFSHNARGWKETAWSGAGSGCSAFEPKPPWQTDAGCPMRTVADVSAVADPKTGVAILYNGTWLVAGGTSVGSPIAAAVYALAGNAGSVVGSSWAYSHAKQLYDIKQGSNGSCGGSYLCTARKGYDGPTGLGTPKGTHAYAETTVAGAMARREARGTATSTGR